MRHRHSLLSLAALTSFILAPDKDTAGGAPVPPPATVGAQLEQLNKDLAAAKQSITALTGERDSARTELATAKDSITALTGERDNARTELATAKDSITALTGERDQARAKVTELEAAAKTASERAADIAAGQGIPPVKGTAGSEGSKADQAKALVEQYNAIKDPSEKAAFFKKNENAMLI